MSESYQNGLLPDGSPLLNPGEPFQPQVTVVPTHKLALDQKKALKASIREMVEHPSEELLALPLYERVNLVRELYNCPLKGAVGLGTAGGYDEDRDDWRIDSDICLTMYVEPGMSIGEPFIGYHPTQVAMAIIPGSKYVDNLFVPLHLCEGRRARIHRKDYISQKDFEESEKRAEDAPKYIVSEKSLPFVDFIEDDEPERAVMLKDDVDIDEVTEGEIIKAQYEDFQRRESEKAESPSE